MKIACIGDSITEGSGLATPSLESYPARLQRLTGTNEFHVRNFGVSGRTLLKKADFPYWKEAAFTNSLNFAPDVVIIQLGTNDGKSYNWRYGTNFISDYKELVSIYAALPSAPQIILCVPCPVYGNGAFDVNPGIVRTNVAPAVRQVAEELGLSAVDLQNRMNNPAWFPDTVHPNSQGSAVMASILFDAVFGSPAEAPAISFERLSPTRLVVSWPVNAGGFVPRSSTSLNSTNWSVLAPVTGRDGNFLRQTNNLPITAERYFKLERQ
jgi:lysophospholipase L1-like esterase